MKTFQTIDFYIEFNIFNYFSVHTYIFILLLFDPFRSFKEINLISYNFID